MRNVRPGVLTCFSVDTQRRDRKLAARQKLQPRSEAAVLSGEGRASWQNCSAARYNGEFTGHLFSHSELCTVCVFCVILRVNSIKWFVSEHRNCVFTVRYVLNI